MRLVCSAYLKHTNNPVLVYSQSEFGDITERELDERNFWKSLTKGVSKVAKVAGPIVSNFIREDEIDAREWDDEEIFARDM